MINISKYFCGQISREEIDNLSSSNGLNHPLLYLLSNDSERIESNRYNVYTQNNTKDAINNIIKFDKAFFDKKKCILISNDTTNASAALGEIRCYGLLLEVFGKECVFAINERAKQGIKTPDFGLNINEQEIHIEVNTLQINQDEGKELSQFVKCIPNNTNEVIHIDEHITRPYGIKKHAGTTLSVIYKLSSVKQKAEQLQNLVPSIIWVDCQDEYMNSISDRMNVSGPIFSGMSYGGCANGFWTNELWYSAYAKENTPVFEGVTLDSREGISCKLPCIKIDGRFANLDSKNVSAIVFCGTNSVMIYENPYACCPLPLDFVDKLTSCKHFNLETSRTNYPDNNLQKRIELDYELIEELGKKQFYSW